MNPYLDINYVDRTSEIESLYESTLQDIKNDPEMYAELVNDLLFHWIYATRETPLMNMVKKQIKKDYADGGMMAKGGRTRYNKGRAWTLDHNQHNKKESYEIPMNKRKSSGKSSQKSSSRKRYTYIPNAEIESITTWNGVEISGDNLLDGAYAKGNVKYADGGMMAKGGDLRSKLSIGSEIVGSRKMYFIYNSETGKKSRYYQSKEDAEKELSDMFDGGMMAKGGDLRGKLSIGSERVGTRRMYFIYNNETGARDTISFLNPKTRYYKSEEEAQKALDNSLELAHEIQSFRQKPKGDIHSFLKTIKDFKEKKDAERGKMAKGGRFLNYFEMYDEVTGKTLYIQAYSFEEAEEIASTIEFDNFKDGEEIEYGVMAKGGRTRYNEGRAWTLDHYQHNKKESYEIPTNQRKRSRL